MFNLEQEILDWRKQMLAAGFKNPEALDELESHLREDFEHQIISGLRDQQAFEMAVQQIGQGKALLREFNKMSASSPGERFVHWGLIVLCFFSACEGLFVFWKSCFVLSVPPGEVYRNFRILGAMLGVLLGLGMVIGGGCAASICVRKIRGRRGLTAN